MFNNNIIRKRVMAHINNVIAEAEKDLVFQTKVLEDKLKADKEALIETHVDKILGKIR